jgi:hypothetical protein
MECGTDLSRGVYNRDLKTAAKQHCENARTALPLLLGCSALGFSKSLADLPKSSAVLRNHWQTFAESAGAVR